MYQIRHILRSGGQRTIRRRMWQIWYFVGAGGGGVTSWLELGPAGASGLGAPGGSQGCLGVPGGAVQPGRARGSGDFSPSRVSEPPATGRGRGCAGGAWSWPWWPWSMVHGSWTVAARPLSISGIMTHIQHETGGFPGAVLGGGSAHRDKTLWPRRKATGSRPLGTPHYSRPQQPVSSIPHKARQAAPGSPTTPANHRPGTQTTRSGSAAPSAPEPAPTRPAREPFNHPPTPAPTPRPPQVPHLIHSAGVHPRVCGEGRCCGCGPGGRRGSPPRERGPAPPPTSTASTSSSPAAEPGTVVGGHGSLGRLCAWSTFP